MLGVLVVLMGGGLVFGVSVLLVVFVFEVLVVLLVGYLVVMVGGVMVVMLFMGWIVNWGIVMYLLLVVLWEES